jgi:hypothetical protein
MESKLYKKAKNSVGNNDDEVLSESNEDDVFDSKTATKNKKRTILTSTECGYHANLIKKKLANTKDEMATINQDDEGEHYTELFN